MYITLKHELIQIVIDDWIEFRSPGKVAVLIKQLRTELDKLLVEKIDQPQVRNSIEMAAFLHCFLLEKRPLQ